MNGSSQNPSNAASVPRHRFGIVDLVNLTGSIASITGISLLWLKDSVPTQRLLSLIPIVAIDAALSLGLLASAFVGIRFGYRCLPGKADFAVKLAYFGLTIAVVLLLLLGAGWFIFEVSRETVLGP
jgi:hypothetical protein